MSTETTSENLEVNTQASGNMDVFASLPEEVRIRTKKMMMWFIIFAIVMLFAGITSALIVLYGKLMWVHIHPPTVFWVSNLLVILSSITLILAVKQVKKGNQKGAISLTAITFILGLAFVATQNSGWSQLSNIGMGYSITEEPNGMKKYRWNALGRIQGEYDKDYWIEYQGQPLVKEGNEFYRASDTGRLQPVTTQVMTTFNAAGALLSVLIYVHIIHLFFGLIYLAVNMVRVAKGRINAQNWISLHAGGMYWHFMGILWLYLFFFLFFVY
jgi:cytochrome c oxidase subunit III